MASIHPYRGGPRGTSCRAFWHTSDGVQRAQAFPSEVEAREWRATVERFDAAGQVIETLYLKPKTAETYASLLRSRILPTFGGHLLSVGRVLITVATPAGP